MTKSLLQINASDVGCVDVLQEGEDDVYHSVEYFSKTFSKCQRNYSTVKKKKSLSLLLALQYFDVYFYSSAHLVVSFTDQNPLIFVNKMRNKNQRLMRHSLELQEHNIVIKHIKGR